MDRQDIQENKIYAALSYWGFLLLIPLVFRRNSRYARFHANQGLVVFLGVLLFELACSAMDVLIGNDPNLDVFIVCIAWGCNLFFLVLQVLGTIRAVKGETIPLPLIGQFQILKS